MPPARNSSRPVAAAPAQKLSKEGTLVFTGPLGKSGPCGAKVRQQRGDVTVTHGPFSDSTLMRASGFALIRANSREDAIQKTKEFLEVAGDGESEILQVMDMLPPGDSPK